MTRRRAHNQSVVITSGERTSTAESPRPGERRRGARKAKARRLAKGARTAPKITRTMTPEEAARFGPPLQIDDDLKERLRRRTIALREALAEMGRRQVGGGR